MPFLLRYRDFTIPLTAANNALALFTMPDHTNGCKDYLNGHYSIRQNRGQSGL